MHVLTQHCFFIWCVVKNEYSNSAKTSNLRELWSPLLRKNVKDQGQGKPTKERICCMDKSSQNLMLYQVKYFVRIRNECKYFPAFAKITGDKALPCLSKGMSSSTNGSKSSLCSNMYLTTSNLYLKWFRPCPSIWSPNALNRQLLKWRDHYVFTLHLTELLFQYCNI